MAKITKQEALAAVEMALVVLIGGPLLLAIPILGSLLSMLPTWTVSIVDISLPAIVAGAIAILVYSLIKAKIKR